MLSGFSRQPKYVAGLTVAKALPLLRTDDDLDRMFATPGQIFLVGHPLGG